MAELNAVSYLAFPFRVEAGGPRLSGRAAHVREAIDQVLFTHPGERVFRPTFGAGLKALLFEPNDSPLWAVARRRLVSSLADALAGEVDPQTLDVRVTGRGEELRVEVVYTLATLGRRERHEVRGGFGVKEDGDG